MIDRTALPSGSASALGQARGLDATLAALAEPNRRAVIDLLRAEPRRASDLADALGLTRPAASRHLKILRASGLVEPASDDADARVRMYRLRPAPFDELRDWLVQVQRYWTGQLDAFKEYAEQQPPPKKARK